jgi:Cupin superfamily protein
LLCRSLIGTYPGVATAKAFITPPNQPGFDVHFDPCSVFVVQLEGRKHWKVWDQFSYHPNQTMSRTVRLEELGAAAIDVVLEPGDVLYLPSGFPHGARCLAEHSCHISFSLYPIKTGAVFRFALNRAFDQIPSLRDYVLTQRDDEKAKATTALRDFVRFLESMDLTRMAEDLSASMNASLPEIEPYGISNASYQSRLTGSSLFHVRKSSLPRLENCGETIRITYASSMVARAGSVFDAPYIQIPAVAAEELTAIISASKPTAIADLPGSLDENSKVMLVGELARRGVLNLVGAQKE